MQRIGLRPTAERPNPLDVHKMSMINSVFVLQHVAREDAPDEDVKFIGVYSTQALAEGAVARLVVQPGFRDYPRGFHIDEYAVDEDNWTEGFGFN